MTLATDLFQFQSALVLYKIYESKFEIRAQIHEIVQDILNQKSNDAKKNEVLLERWNHDLKIFENEEYQKSQNISDDFQRKAEDFAKTLKISQKSILDQFQIGLKQDFYVELSKMKLSSRHKSFHYYNQVFG